MTVPWAKERLLLSAPNPEDAEIEALQTDVMRFMAILGFILSVIFALVQSLPFTPKELNPTLEHYDYLQGDIATLNDYIQSQLDLVEQIKKELQDLDAAKQKSLSELTEIDRQRVELTIEARRASDQLKKHQNDLTRIERQVTRQDKSLRALRFSLERERNELRQVQKQLTELREKTLELRRKRDIVLADSKSAPGKTSKSSQLAAKPKPIEKPKALKNEVPKPVSPPKRVGFTLKFKSDDAFNQLLARESIEFYVLVGARAWRVRLLGEKPEFIKAAKPKRIHEMDQLTVPRQYITGFRRVVAAHGRIAGTWGVVLPTSISRTIQVKIRDRQGGDVIIDGDGTVRLENSNP